jgi:hypothetical protein
MGFIAIQNSIIKSYQIPQSCVYCGGFDNCCRIEVVLELCFDSYGITFNIFMDKLFDSIFNFHLEHNIMSHIMNTVMETVLQFRAVSHCDVWE